MFVPPMVLFLAKHTKNKVFSIKKSQFVTKMRLPKKLQFLVPGTPPEPPIPPLTPPRGPGGPKMAKMHSLKSNNDNQCQKSHFRGVKNFDLFFHLECPLNSFVAKGLLVYTHNMALYASEQKTGSSIGAKL